MHFFGDFSAMVGPAVPSCLLETLSSAGFHDTHSVSPPYLPATPFSFPVVGLPPLGALSFGIPRLSIPGHVLSKSSQNH